MDTGGLFLLVAMLRVMNNNNNFSGFGVFVENMGLSVSWFLVMVMLQIGDSLCDSCFFWFLLGLAVR